MTARASRRGMKPTAILGLVCSLLCCDGITDGYGDQPERPDVRGTYRLAGIDGVLPQTLTSRDGEESFTVQGSRLQMMDIWQYALTVDHTVERTGERRTLTVRGSWLWYGAELRFEPWNDGCADEGLWHDDGKVIEIVADCSYGRHWVFRP